MRDSGANCFGVAPRQARERSGTNVKRRAPAEPNALGTLLQILLVGVLLFAVIWQVGGAVPTPGEGADPEASISTATWVTTGEVNLRSGPGLQHGVLAVMPLHAQVTVTGAEQAGFLPVESNGGVAWISSEYVVSKGSVLGALSGDVPNPDEPVPPRATVPELLVANVSAADVEPAPTEPTVLPTAVPVEEEPVAAQTHAEPAADISVAEEPGERWIEVDRSTKTVTLHEGDQVVAQFPALLGRDPSRDGYYATAVGTFYVHVKEPALTETPFAPGVYLTDFVGFDPARSNGFHSPTRDANGTIVQTGGTATQGCVRLGEDEARFLYDFAYIGMRVEVHD
jgi:lipoprotein-anchoring transpeptidase ErfK/SrfK